MCYLLSNFVTWLKVSSCELPNLHWFEFSFFICFLPLLKLIGKPIKLHLKLLSIFRLLHFEFDFHFIEKLIFNFVIKMIYFSDIVRSFSVATCLYRRIDKYLYKFCIFIWKFNDFLLELRRRSFRVATCFRISN